MKDLEWTRTYPIEKGFYWCRFADGECVVVLAEDPLCTGEMEIYWAGAEEHSTRKKMENGDGVEWYGPIHAPE